MFWGHFQTVLLLSACASALLWILRPVRPVFGLAGGAGWTVLALQGRNIVVDPADTGTTVGLESMQYVYLGMALLSIATVVLWHLGVYPPESQDEANERAAEGSANIPDEPARMQGD